MAIRRPTGAVSSFAGRLPVLAGTRNARRFGYGGADDLNYAEDQSQARHSDLWNNSPTGLTPSAPVAVRNRVGGLAPATPTNVAPVVTPPVVNTDPKLNPDYAPIKNGVTPTAGQVARIYGTTAKPQLPIVQAATTPGTTPPTPIGSGEALSKTSMPPVTPTMQSNIPGDPFAGIDLTTATGPAPFSLDTYQRTPSTAESAGATVKGVVQSIPKNTTFGASATPELPPAAPILDIPKVVGDFTRGLFGSTPNASTGISNQSAAQFQKPTKDNPLPVTDTTPTANIDKADTSLAKFGLSEDEMARKKQLMTSL